MSDPFVTRRDLNAMWRGVRNGLLIGAPVWALIVWLVTR